MKFTVLSLFPEITDAYFASSIMAKALEKGIIQYQAVNIRDFATDKHKTCDDAPYGGGPGMLMLAEPLSRALESTGARKKVPCYPPAADSLEFSKKVPGTFFENSTRVIGGKELGGAQQMHASRRACCGDDRNTACPPTKAPIPLRGGNGDPKGRNVGGPGDSSGGTEQTSGNRPPYIIYLSPSGRPFNQRRAEELAAMDELVLVCGRYEGIDQRIIEAYVDEELSVGDYVLSSGEAAALTVIDAVYRLVDRVITRESLEEESFSGGLLEYPQYTRPEVFDTMKVPEVLLSGHHENIRKWRLKMRVEKTRAVRPELLERGLREGLFDAETVKLIEEGKEDERDKGD